ncbi:MAG TPA: hypothetical protein VNK44_01335 [Candidatus Nitrosotenuis sp.]|nr:hypothetical protein [Candidatus Nitrosotenuis sp.]
MQKKLAILAALVLSVGLVGSAYAHKSEVVGNYKIEVGWKNEPPKVGKKNAIEITVTKATPSDKKSKHDHGSHNDMKQKTKKTLYEQEPQNIKLVSTTKDSKHKHDDKTKKKPIGVSGLGKSLEVDVTLNGKKTFLNLVEDKKNKGTYYGEYTPDSEGFPTVHIVGKILNTPIEMTFHPEKVVKS